MRDHKKTSVFSFLGIECAANFVGKMMKGKVNGGVGGWVVEGESGREKGRLRERKN
jgi:hypothetical protein